MTRRTLHLFQLFVWNIFAAPITLANVAGIVYKKPASKPSKCTFFAGAFCTLFSTFVVFCTLQAKFSWSWAVAFFVYLSFCACVATVRMHTRQTLDISGHIVEDFVSSFFFYPSVVVQLDMALENTLDIGTGSKTYIFDAPI